MINIAATIEGLEAMAASMRAEFARSERRADNDAAYDFAEAAQHLRAAGRRVATMETEAAAREATQPRKRNLFNLRKD